MPDESARRIELRFQDAGADADYLLEALLDACEGATAGGALMAWTNASGTSAFLGNETFGRFIESGRFDLVVGLDSITDVAAVSRLTELADRWPGLSVRAFMHDKPTLFHPKLAWFTSEAGLTLIVGSGNLTMMGGLKGNWEAFTISRLTGADADGITTQIAGWMSTWKTFLVPVDDPRVRDRAARNTGIERALKAAPATLPADPAAAEAGIEVLVAEIPKSNNRWSQANFDIENYERFFGAEVGTKKQILLYHVRDDGTLDDVEPRPSVQVKSRNYRFELAAARGLPYPADGRPIGVFMRLSAGAFLYTLLLPASPGYPIVSRFLGGHAIVRSGRLRRYRTTVADLRAVWPDAVLWQARLP